MHVSAGRVTPVESNSGHCGAGWRRLTAHELQMVALPVQVPADVVAVKDTCAVRGGASHAQALSCHQMRKAMPHRKRPLHIMLNAGALYSGCACTTPPRTRPCACVRALQHRRCCRRAAPTAPRAHTTAILPSRIACYTAQPVQPWPTHLEDGVGARPR